MRPLRILLSLLVLVTLACTSQEERITQHREAANQYFEAEQWSEAKIEFLNLLQLAPDDAEAHFKMAETLWNLQEFGEALWQYSETARLAPTNVEWRLKVAKGLPDGKALVRELLDFKREITTRGNAMFGGDREHDDLVIALALAVWWAVPSTHPKLAAICGTATGR